MVHNAFDAVAVVSECPLKVTSLALWNSRLFLACIDGSLRLYCPQEEQHRGLYSLRHTLVAFAKKPVTCMHALPACLISLSDVLAVHLLPDLDLLTTLSKSRGANLYAWDPLRSYLAVAVKKRLIIYRLDGGKDFLEVKELQVADTVRSMVWCDDSLCLGIRRDYLIINVSTGVFIDVFPAGRIAPPLAVSLNDHQLLLGKENVGVFVDKNGKLNQQDGISWSEPPGHVVTHGPYALARMSRHIEVRSLRAPHGLVQTIPIREPQLLLSDHAGVVAASDTAVYLLLTVPIAVQVVQLAASSNFEDALALCALLPPEDAALRIAKEDAIHIRYGYYLFDKGEYVQAMEQFAASFLDLVTILSLFPSIKLPSWVSRPASDHFQADGQAPSPKSPQLDAAIGSLSDNREQPGEKVNTDALTALSGFLSGRRGAVIGKAQTEETSAAVAAIVEVTKLKHGAPGDRKQSEDQGTAVASQLQRRPRELAVVLETALVQAWLATGHQQSALELLRGPNYCDVAACEEVMLAGGHYAELLELYSHNQKHREALELLNRLAQSPESLPVPPAGSQQYGPQSIVDYILPLGDRDPPLVLEASTWMLRSKPEHALKLFTSLRPPLPAKLVLPHLKEHAPQLQAAYLESVLTEQPQFATPDLQNELVQLFLSRVLMERDELLAQGKWDEREHSVARQKLFATLENSSSSVPEAIFRQLPSDGLYEERAFLLGRMGQHKLALTLYAQKLHERELALSYCDRVYSSVLSGSRSHDPFDSSHGQNAAEQDAANVYITLLEVYLMPEAAVREFDRSIARLPASKGGALNQKVGGGGQKIKGNVVKKIAQIVGAENAARYSIDGSRSDSDEGFGATGAAEEPMVDEALRLLGQRWDRMNCAQALRMIPSDTQLQQLLPYLEPLLRKSSETCRNMAVIKNLQSSEHIQVREELLQCRKRMVKVTSERTCSICHKRIGNSVFAVYPSNQLAHFVCYRDQQAAKSSAILRAAGP